MTYIQLCSFLVTLLFYSEEMMVLLTLGESVRLRSEELKYNIQYFILIF